jgi:hypothetical protein
MPKQKLENLTQVHGKDEFAPQSLEQIWGDSGEGKYRTMEIDAYSQSLSEMNRSDLQTHAVKIGIIPVDDRNLLVQRLLREFKRHVSNYRIKTDEIKPTKASKDVLSILSEGR